MKIKDEMKIDLGNADSSPASSVRSAPKIYPINEVSEAVSRASSKMVLEQNKKMREVQRIMEENRRKARPKSRSRNSPVVRSPLRITSDVEVFKPFCPLDESQSESEFAEEFEESHDRNESSSYRDRLDQFKSSFGSLASYKSAQIHRLTNDGIKYHTQKHRSRNYNDNESCHELLSVRTYSTTTTAQESCFGCIFKPLAQMCRRKSKKN